MRLCEGAWRQMFLVSSTAQDFVLCHGGGESQDTGGHDQELNTGKMLLLAGEIFISVPKKGARFG